MADIWQIWMALAVIFVVGEIFTAGFFLFWFGVGAVVYYEVTDPCEGDPYNISNYYYAATKLILPYEATGLLGSIAGIAEMLKEKTQSPPSSGPAESEEEDETA